MFYIYSCIILFKNVIGSIIIIVAVVILVVVGNSYD